MLNNSIKKIEQILIDYKNVQKESLEINVMFVNSNVKRKNKKFKGYMVNISKDDIMPVVQTSMDNIEKEVKKNDFSNYDFEVSDNKKTYIIEEKNVFFSKDIIEEITLEQNNFNTIGDLVNFEKLNFVVIQVYFNNKKLYLFSRYIHPGKALKNTYKYTLNSKKPKLIKDDILTISSYVDAFLYDGSYFIFNEPNFRKIFKFDEAYKKLVDLNKEKIKYIFTKETSFIEDCIKDGRYLPRLAKLLNSDILKNIDKDKVKHVISFHKLQLNTDSSGLIEYENKSNIPLILNLFLDHYVITSLTQEKKVAKAFE